MAHVQSDAARVWPETHFHSRQVHVARTLRHLIYTRIIRVAERVRGSFCVSVHVASRGVRALWPRGTFVCGHVTRVCTYDEGW